MQIANNRLQTATTSESLIEVKRKEREETVKMVYYHYIECCLVVVTGGDNFNYQEHCKYTKKNEEDNW